MATKKKLLQAAAGTAAASGGAGALNVEDVFSTYLYEGNGGTKVIENGINLGQSYGSGSVEFEQNSSYLKLPSEITLTGDFTIEAMVWSNSGFTSQNQILGSDTGGGSNLNTQVYIQNTTNYLSLYDNGAAHRSTSAVPQDQWVHIAITRSGSTVTFYINGTASGTSSTSATIAVWAVGALIAGATVYEDYYGYISNVRIVDGSVVYTSNFTPPTSDLTAITNTQLLTCQGDSPFVDNSSNSYALTATNTPIAKTFGPFDAADAGEGGLVWIKNRTYSQSHALFDTERGAGDILQSDLTLGEYTGGTDLSSFNSSGFTLGSSSFTAINSTSNDYASWTFRKAPKFFDVVTYTGNGTAGRTVSHNLGSVPAFIVIKRTDSTGDWTCYHRSLGNAKDIQLNYSSPAYNSSAWNSTTPTDSVFTLGSSTSINGSGATYVAYLFAHNDGDGEFGSTADQDVIKCGSYTGDGSGSSSTVIDLGFEPQWVMIKNTTNNDNWYMFDSMRGITSGGNNSSPTDADLRANSTNAEYEFNRIALEPNGFRLEYNDGTQVNGLNQDYIYIAIRRGPMAVPTAATDVFAATDMSSSYLANTGFPVDLSIDSSRVNSSSNYVNDRLRGSGAFLATDSTAAEASGGTRHFDSNDGVIYTTGFTGINWSWKRAPSFFDVVAYTGNSTAGRTVSHNLGVAPEMIWYKPRNLASDWIVWNKYVNNGEARLKLHATDAASTASIQYYFGDNTNYIAPTDTGFTISNGSAINGSGNTYIAYLFASLDGVSKVGSYTGNGTSQNIDCGFSSGARFVLIKNYFATGENWIVFDSERGIVSGNDALLSLNTTDSEITNSDLIDPHPSGFSLPNGFGEVNSDGHTYIFYAIA